jgi:uncharacterized protein (TIGR02001 family)
MTAKSRYSAIAAASLGLVAFTGSASATELGNTGFDLSGNVALSSDYTFRGISQTNEGPAFQGGFDLSHESGFYVGNWNSNVEFGDASLEMDTYAGWAGSFNNFGVDVGAVYFFYPDTSEADDNFDYGEIYGTLSYDFGVASVSAGVDLTDEFFGESGDAQHYRAGVSVPFAGFLSADGSVGYQAIDENDTFGTPDYWHYTLGLSASFAENYSAGISFTDTDLDDSDCFGGDELCDSRFQATLSASF